MTSCRSTITIQALCLALSLSLAACSSTRMMETWAAPDLDVETLQFDHVVAIAVTPSVAAQREAEDVLCQEVTRTRVTPAYRLVEPEDRQDPNRLREVLEEQGVDGAITVRVVDIDHEEVFVPDATTHRVAYAGDYYGFYGSRVYQPGHYRTDTVYKIETSLRSVRTGKLLWAGASKTINPQDVDSVIREIVAAAREDLRDRGLLP